MLQLFEFFRRQIVTRRIRDQKALRISIFFRQFAFSMTGVFTVALIYDIGANFLGWSSLRSGIIAVVLARMLMYGFLGLSVVPIGNQIIRVIGYRRTILLSVIISGLSFMCLSLASSLHSLPLIYLFTLLSALSIATYWVTYNTLFADDSLGKVSQNLGGMQALVRISQAAAPLVGGFLAVRFGYEVLYFVANLLLIISGVPALFLKHHLHLDEVSFKEFFAWVKEARYRRAGVAIGGYAVDDEMLLVIWPLMVFLLLGDLGQLGLFSSAVLLANAVFALFVVVLFGKGKYRIYQFITACASMVMWPMRLLSGQLSQVIAVDTVDRFFSSTWRHFVLGYAFERSQGRQSFSFWVYYELWRSLFILGAYSVLLVVIVAFDYPAFQMTVALAGMAGIAASLLLKSSK